MKIVAVLIFILFSFVLVQDAIFPETISLVELQKKEKKRRKKTVKSKYVLTDSSIIYLSTGKKRVSFINTDGNLSNTGQTEKKSNQKKVLIDPKKTEKYWKQQTKMINERIMKLKEQITNTQLSMNKAQTNYLNLSIPSQINDARARLTELSARLNELKSRLKSAELAKENLYDNARKAGALPGWLR